MSETVYYKGKLVLLNKNGESIEEITKNIFNKRNASHKYEKYYKDACEWYDKEDHIFQYMFDELCYESYYIRNGKIYEVKDKKECDEYCDVYNVNVLSEDKIEFETKYYNGSCGFNEALDEAFDKLDKQNNMSENKYKILDPNLKEDSELFVKDFESKYKAFKSDVADILLRTPKELFNIDVIPAMIGDAKKIRFLFNNQVVFEKEYEVNARCYGIEFKEVK